LLLHFVNVTSKLDGEINSITVLKLKHADSCYEQTFVLVTNISWNGFMYHMCCKSGNCNDCFMMQ